MATARRALDGVHGASASSPWGVFGFAQQPGKTAQGWLWAATDQGVARFDGQQWELLRGFGAWDAARLRHVDLHQDDGRPVLWASSVRLGVARFDVSDPRSPRLLPSAELPPPPDGTVYSALRDAAGHTYLCTNNGVQQLQRDSQGRWRDRIFRRRDGLVHDECNTSARNGSMPRAATGPAPWAASASTIRRWKWHHRRRARSPSPSRGSTPTGAATATPRPSTRIPCRHARDRVPLFPAGRAE